MKIPTNLKHKPVIVSENYENVNGRYAYNTDAKGISLGLAQWNDRGKVDISAKVWRHTRGKWFSNLKFSFAENNLGRKTVKSKYRVL